MPGNNVNLGDGPGPGFGPNKRPTPAGGAANRLISRHGYRTLVVDTYRQYAGSSDLGDPHFDTIHLKRGETASISNLSSAYVKSYLTTGTVIEGEVIAMFPPLGTDGEFKLFGPGGNRTDVPADEQLPGGKDPSKDKYAASVFYLSRNEEWFEVQSVETEGSGIRRVRGSKTDIETFRERSDPIRGEGPNQ